MTIGANTYDPWTGNGARYVYAGLYTTPAKVIKIQSGAICI